MELVQTFKNAIVAPYTYRQGKFVGGVDARLNCSNGRMPLHSNFLDTPIEIGDAGVYLNGNFLFAGHIWSHFGHTLVDSIHRLWALNNHDAIVFSGVIGLREIESQQDLDNWEAPKFLNDILRVLGIDQSMLHIVKRPTTFERLDVPRPGSLWQTGIEPFYRAHLSRFQDRIESLTKPIDAPERLYYSRSHIITDGGVLGCSYFEKLLSSVGFHVVQPEKLPFETQLAYLLKTKEIAFDEGSSVHTAELLARLKPRFFMFPRRQPDKVFPASIGQRGYYERLAESENVVMLPDANGTRTAASLAFYKDPQPVFDRLRPFGIKQFDKAEYFAAEEADLKRCLAKDNVLYDSRFATLRNSGYRQQILERSP